MGDAYPELKTGATRVMEVLKTEEDRFFATIEHGMAILETELAALAEKQQATFDGETAFKLHDTYGFPLDLTADICREHGVTVDAAAFDAAMARQKAQARAAGKFRMTANLAYAGENTVFQGYEHLETRSRILALYRDGAPVDALNEGEQGVVVLDETPFYAESGGQMGDTGHLQGNGIFAVEDTQKIQAAVFGHHGIVKTGVLRLGDTVMACVDAHRRAAAARNHSVTHLLHKALRDVLGAHVQQRGSQVDFIKTRFDFAHDAPLNRAELHAIEQRVNAEILANAATRCVIMDIESARKSGAVMLFGEKYGDSVRVLSIGTSKEFCGGTHVAHTGDIGFFKITGESGVAAGIRRIEAVTGINALHWAQAEETCLAEISTLLKAQPAEAAGRIGALLAQVRELERERARLKAKLAQSQGDDLVGQAIDIEGVKVLATKLEGADAAALRETLDKLKDKLKSAIIVLASVKEEKVSLIAGVTADLAGKLKAGELVNFVAQQVGGKGGGRADMAQAGGTEPAKLLGALASVRAWVAEKQKSAHAAS
jgi:alanyl-tRNA synthetase